MPDSRQRLSSVNICLIAATSEKFYCPQPYKNCEIMCLMYVCGLMPGYHTAQILVPALTHFLPHSLETPKWNLVADTKEG